MKRVMSEDQGSIKKGFYVYFVPFGGYLLHCLIIAILLLITLLATGPYWLILQFWLPFAFLCVMMLSSFPLMALFFVGLMEMLNHYGTKKTIQIRETKLDWKYQFVPYASYRLDSRSNQYVINDYEHRGYRVYHERLQSAPDLDSCEGLALEVTYLPKSRIVLHMAFPTEEEKSQKHNRQENLDRKAAQDEFRKAFGKYFD